MPSAYSVPMASDVLPDPDTPTTATVRHSGTSTSISLRLLCRAPRTPMTVGKVPGTESSYPPYRQPKAAGPRTSAGRPTTPRPLPAAGAGLAPAHGRCDHGWTGPLGPLSRRSDCMMANVVVVVNSSMSAAASTPVYLAMTGAAARSVTVSRWPLTPAQTFAPPSHRRAPGRPRPVPPSSWPRCRRCTAGAPRRRRGWRACPGARR